MSFEIKIKLDGAKATGHKPAKKAKKVEEGIEYSKWMMFPTCPHCKLEDGGKECSVRPDEIHHLNCTKRPLMKLPLVQTSVGFKDGKMLFEQRPRPGTFRGEALQRQFRYPFRKMLRLPGRDPITKVPTGEFFFFCEYYWKTALVVDFVWNANQWIPWYQFSKESSIKAIRTEPTANEANWMGIFFRNGAVKK